MSRQILGNCDEKFPPPLFALLRESSTLNWEDRKTTPFLSKNLFYFSLKGTWQNITAEHTTETAAISRNTVQEEGCSSISCVILYIVYLYQQKRKKNIAPRCLFFFFIWHFCICSVEVGKVKFNERFTHQRKWDNESDIPQSTGTLWLFFFLSIIIIRLRSKLFFHCFFFHCEK